MSTLDSNGLEELTRGNIPPTLNQPTTDTTQRSSKRSGHVKNVVATALEDLSVKELKKLARQEGIKIGKNPKKSVLYHNLKQHYSNTVVRGIEITPPRRLQGADAIRGHPGAIESELASDVLYHVDVDHKESEAKKEEVSIENATREEKRQQQLIHAMANQSIQIDSEKMRIALQLGGITSSAEQDRIIGEVQRRNAGFGEQVDIMSQSNREAEALARLPATAISPETTLPLMAEMNCDHQFVPRIGAYLVENIKDQERIPKTGLIVRKPSIIAKTQGVLENNRNIDKKILANHELSQLSFVEKTMNGVQQQGADIQKYDPKVQQWFQEFSDGNTGQF